MHATRVAFPHSLCHEAARRAGPKPFSTPVLLQWFRVQVSALHWQTLFSPKRLVVVSRLCRQSHLGKVVATCLWRLHLASHGFPTVVDSFTQLALVMWAFVHSRIFWDGSRHWGGCDSPDTSLRTPAASKCCSVRLCACCASSVGIPKSAGLPALPPQCMQAAAGAVSRASAPTSTWDCRIRSATDVHSRLIGRASALRRM